LYNIKLGYAQWVGIPKGTRTYTYTDSVMRFEQFQHSMIDIRLSVCLYIVAFKVSCTSVFLSGILSLQTLFCSMYRLATKLTEKRVEENANVSFFETDNRACTGPVTFCYSL